MGKHKSNPQPEASKMLSNSISPAIENSLSADQINLLVNTIQNLSLARNLETIMDIVRRAARKLTGADGATFVLKDGDQCFYAEEDAIEPLWKGKKFPMSICISGWAMMNRKPAIIQDIYQDPRIPQEAYRPTFVKSLAMVPIREQEPIGAIGNYWANQHLPTAVELQLLQTLANSTSIAIENVQLYAGLENKVKERTQELEEINNELKTFSYSVSHDLKAPLRAIEGFGNILQAQLESVGQKEIKLLNNILESTQYMKHLIDGLLKFSSSTRAPINITEINTAEWVKSIAEDLFSQVSTMNAKITYKDLLPIQADPILIKEVFTNYIQNALKYTKNTQKALIEIGSEAVGEEIIFYVKDNGVGFDEKYSNKLFTAFQRLHSANEFEGTGIGLAIVQRIIARHHGRVWAKAERNKGATFFFSLPKKAGDFNQH